MEFDINPNELSLQGPDGMQLVQILRKLIVAIDGGGYGPEPTQVSGLYYCTYGTTTSAQISQAITDGLLPVCVYGGRYYYLVYRQVNIFTFASVDQTQLILYRIRCNGSTWSYTSAYLQEYLDFDYTPTQGSTNPVTSGGVWTAIQQGGGGSDIDPYQQYPAMDGTASPGSSDDYARGDHVHPTDMSRAAASEITRIDAALAGKADQTSIEQTIEDTVDEWLTAQAPSIGTLSYAAKQALLACFRKVAWVDGQGQSYYNTLESELFPDATLESITAVFTQGGAVIYDTDSLDTLKQYLTVTATFSDSTTETVTGYALSGTLTAGTSTITVSYSGKTTTFNVTVTETIKINNGTFTFADGSTVSIENNHVIIHQNTLESGKNKFINLSSLSDNTTSLFDASNVNNKSTSFMAFSSGDHIKLEVLNASSNNTTWASGNYYDLAINFRKQNATTSVLPSAVTLYPAQNTPNHQRVTDGYSENTFSESIVASCLFVYFGTAYPANTTIEFDIRITY